MNERGALCPVCKVDTIRTNGAYVCPCCGRVMGFTRPAPPQRTPGGRVEVEYIAGRGFVRKGETA